MADQEDREGVLSLIERIEATLGPNGEHLKAAVYRFTDVIAGEIVGHADRLDRGEATISETVRRLHSLAAVLRATDL